MGSTSRPSRDKIRRAKGNLLESLYFRSRSCEGCACSAHRKRTLVGAGNPDAPVAVVLDRVSPEEFLGVDFPSGGAGESLLSVIEYTGATLDDVHILPPIMCPPVKSPYDKFGRPLELAVPPSKEAIAACRPLLHEALRIISPAIVVAMGSNAVKALCVKTGAALPVGRVHEVMLEGAVAPYAASVMVTHSPTTLHRTPPSRDPDRVWAQVAEHLEAAVAIGRELRSNYGS